jgi:hypothetical protein
MFDVAPVKRRRFLQTAVVGAEGSTVAELGRIEIAAAENLYASADVSIPAAVSVFPGKSYQAPRSWTERAYL